MSKSKKELSNNKRMGLFAVVIVLVIAIIGIVSYQLLKPEKKDKPVDNTPKNIVSIDGYGISYNEFDTDLYKDEFELLKRNLTSDSIDEEAYANSVAKMFIIDLYTIKNKVNKYDIGGADFVYPAKLENYKMNVSETMYKYVEDNTNGKRNQQLPVVNEINVVSNEKIKFEIKDDGKYDAYKIKLKWDYTVDYGYDKSGEVIVIKKDNKLYVVEKN